MESYLKEGAPMTVDELFGSRELVNEEMKKISNEIEITRILQEYPTYDQTISLPDDRQLCIPLEAAIEIFEKECTDSLIYFLSTDIDHKNKNVNIFIIPIIESA